MGCSSLSYFPPSAQSLAPSQRAALTMESPQNTRKFGFNCKVEDLTGVNRSTGDAYLQTIRSLTPATDSKPEWAVMATNPLYLAPGKYGLHIVWATRVFGKSDADVVASSGSDSYLDKSDSVVLDAKAGKTYVLSGKITNHGEQASISYSIKEK